MFSNFEIRRECLEMAFQIKRERRRNSAIQIEKKHPIKALLMMQHSQTIDRFVSLTLSDWIFSIVFFLFRLLRFCETKGLCVAQFSRDSNEVGHK